MTRRWVVRGRVQGVGYRAFAVGAAARLGLAGYTRNLPDGTVEVVATGEPAALDRLAEALQDGPPIGRVTSLETSEMPPAAFEGFRVRP